MGRAIGRGDGEVFSKIGADGSGRGFGPAAMIESAASVAGHGSQWTEGSQLLHYAPHWVDAEPNGEGQNGNSGYKRRVTTSNSIEV